MNPFEVKVFMLKNGLTISSIARDFCGQDGIDVKFRSMLAMLSDLIHGRKWLPFYAEKLEKEYGIKLNPPAARTNREIIQKAA